MRIRRVDPDNSLICSGLVRCAKTDCEPLARSTENVGRFHFYLESSSRHSDLANQRGSGVDSILNAVAQSFPFVSFVATSPVGAQILCSLSGSIGEESAAFPSDRDGWAHITRGCQKCIDPTVVFADIGSRFIFRTVRSSQNLLRSDK